MKDKLTDAIRIGKVSSINPETCMAKVTFEDRKGATTRELFILVPFTLKDQAYYMPAVGERVRVIFDPEAPAKGYILGSFYADNRRPPIKDENKFYVMFEDKTLIEYDKKLHKLTVTIPEAGEKSVDVVTASDITVKSAGNVTVESAKKITISCVADMTLTTAANLKINAGADIAVKSAANITIESAADMELKAGGALTLKGATIDIN